jgi:hypothetical protein
MRGPSLCLDIAEGLRQGFDSGRLVVIERAAHTINFSQPAWLTEVIWPFLTQG